MSIKSISEQNNLVELRVDVRRNLVTPFECRYLTAYRYVGYVIRQVSDLRQFCFKVVLEAYKKFISSCFTLRVCDNSLVTAKRDLGP